MFTLIIFCQYGIIHKYLLTKVRLIEYYQMKTCNIYLEQQSKMDTLILILGNFLTKHLYIKIISSVNKKV